MVHTNNVQLYKGSINKRLNWTFTLAQDPISISLEFDLGTTLATVVSATLLVRVHSPFNSKVNVTWVSGQITLIIFNVTTADEGVYSCEMTSANAKKWKRNIKVEVVGNYKVIVLCYSFRVTVMHGGRLNYLLNFKKSAIDKLKKL